MPPRRGGAAENRSLYTFYNETARGRRLHGAAREYVSIYNNTCKRTDAGKFISKFVGRGRGIPMRVNYLERIRTARALRGRREETTLRHKPPRRRRRRRWRRRQSVPLLRSTWFRGDLPPPTSVSGATPSYSSILYACELLCRDDGFL